MRRQALLVPHEVPGTSASTSAASDASPQAKPSKSWGSSCARGAAAAVTACSSRWWCGRGSRRRGRRPGDLQDFGAAGRRCSRARHRVARAAEGTDVQVLQKIVTRPSKYPEEKAQPGDLVRIHYVGTLDDGTVFDSSRARGEPFQFHLGESEVIDGWDMLIGTMALGECATLVIPPEYAYGETGIPPVIPPDATLTYEVEIVDIGRPIEEQNDAETDSEQADVPTLLDEGKLFWEKDPERESGMGRGYGWQATGSGEEICISVPLDPETRTKDLEVDIRTFTVKCKIAGKSVVEGPLWAEIDMDDSHWDLEGKGGQPYLLIFLAKRDKRLKWQALLKGGDKQEDMHAIEPEVIDVDAALRAANMAAPGRRGRIVDA